MGLEIGNILRGCLAKIGLLFVEGVCRPFFVYAIVILLLFIFGSGYFIRLYIFRLQKYKPIHSKILQSIQYPQNRISKHPHISYLLNNLHNIFIKEHMIFPNLLWIKFHRCPPNHRIPEIPDHIPMNLVTEILHR